MRLCYNCQHMAFDTGSPDWSDVTPGWNPEMRCNKGYWEILFKSTRGDGTDLRAALESANTCRDYEHSIEAIRLGIPDIQEIRHAS